MSRLTLRLPATLHQQLANLADNEGVSLNQFIVYALTRQVSSTYTVHPVPETDVDLQQQMLQSLLQTLGESSSAEVETALAARELVNPEEDLNPEAIALLRQRIGAAVELPSQVSSNG